MNAITQTQQHPTGSQRHSNNNHLLSAALSYCALLLQHKASLATTANTTPLKKNTASLETALHTFVSQIKAHYPEAAVKKAQSLLLAFRDELISPTTSQDTPASHTATSHHTMTHTPSTQAYTKQHYLDELQSDHPITPNSHHGLTFAYLLFSIGFMSGVHYPDKPPMPRDQLIDTLYKRIKTAQDYPNTPRVMSATLEDTLNAQTHTHWPQVKYPSRHGSAWVVFTALSTCFLLTTGYVLINHQLEKIQHAVISAVK